MSTTKSFHGVTLHGVPVRLDLEWPFHASAGGSDWYVIHGRLALADGGELHADIALNLSQTIKEALPSLDGELAFRVAVNTARKALDDKQVELLKSGKRQPVPVSSRSYSIRRGQFSFVKAAPEQVAEFVARKVFWCGGLERNRVLIADECDAQYLDATDEAMLEKLRTAAKDLASRGMMDVDGDYARATDALAGQAAAFEATKEQFLEALHAKHAFERG
jgi:hypothetical protein